MAEFLTTHLGAAHIENIIKNSKSGLFLVSPYLRVSRTFIERLKDADERGVRILIIYGKDELNPIEKTQLKQLKNLTLLFYEHVHAKCYFNEETMVITSMNMHEFPEKTNREMGVLINRNEDLKLFDEAKGEVESIIKAVRRNETQISSPQSLPPKVQTLNENKPKARIQQTEAKKGVAESIFGVLNAILGAPDGYCIRCHDSIPFDQFHPLRDKCYSEWARYKNDTYLENYCHSCGKKRKTSKARPLCAPCYSMSVKGN
jgi:hypothetical protein